MKKFSRISMALICFGILTSASAEQGDKSPRSVLQQSTQTIEIAAPDEAMLIKQYKETVLKQIAQGKTVTVPADKIGYFRGAVRLVPHKYNQSANIKATKANEYNLSSQIEARADLLKNLEAKKALKSFAARASTREKIDFLYFGKAPDLRKYSPLMKAASSKSKGNCYESCQTLCGVTCHETCTWDCQLVHGEEVCSESCNTICPEVCNLVCHWTCP